MKKSRFRTDQIIGIVKEHEAGMKAPDLARKHEVSEHTIYRWRAKYGGMSVSDAARQKALKDENRRLKRRRRPADRDSASASILTTRPCLYLMSRSRKRCRSVMLYEHRPVHHLTATGGC